MKKTITPDTGTGHEQSPETPLPVAHYERTYSVSRTSLWRWEKEGLRILHVGGKRFIKPSDWIAFIEQQDSKAKTTAGKGAS